MGFGLEARELQNDVFFEKVGKTMEVDEIIENTNTIAILAFVVITIKLIVVPALFNNY